MNRSALFAIVLVGIAAVVAGILFYTSWERSRPPEIMGTGPSWPRDRILSADAMEVRNVLGTFRLQLRGDTWWLVSPVEDEARPALMERILTRLAGVRFGVSFRYDASKAKEWKLTPSLAVKVVLYSQGKELMTLWFGKSREYALMRIGDSDTVWQLKGPVRQMFVKNTLGWLDPRVLPIRDTSVRTVTFEDAETGLKTSFSIDKRLHATPRDVPQEIREHLYLPSVTRSVVLLTKLRAEKIMKGSDIGKVVHTITLTDERGYTHTVEFGRTEGPLVAFRSSKRRWAGWVRKTEFDRIAKRRPEDFVSTIAISFPKERIASLVEIEGSCGGFSYTFRKEGGTWKNVKSSKPLTPSLEKIKEYLSLLERGYLRGEFVRKGTLDKVTDTMKYTFDDGSTVIVRLGPLTPYVYEDNYLRPVTVSTRPGLVYYVTVRRTDQICRTRDRWLPPTPDD